jgi:GLPGLI family protein
MYIAEYEVNWQPDSLDVNSKINLENYKLLFNSSNSVFISGNRLGLDSLIYSTKAKFEDINSLMSLPKPSSNKRIFNNNSDTLTIVNEIRGQLFKYTDIVKLKWKLSNEVDSINNRAVKKATTTFRGRKYIALYSKEIALPVGPYKFFGLPGLIVQIYDDKNQISFDLINLKDFNKKLTLDYNGEASLVRKKEFKKVENQYNSNPIPYMESQGAVFTEENKRIIKEKFRKKNEKTNNPIELKEENE